MCLNHSEAEPAAVLAGPRATLSGFDCCTSSELNRSIVANTCKPTLHQLTWEVFKRKLKLLFPALKIGEQQPFHPTTALHGSFSTGPSLREIKLGSWAAQRSIKVDALHPYKNTHSGHGTFSCMSKGFDWLYNRHT